MATNVLILCTHNSARSVLSEGMLNHLARQHGKNVRAYSAGSSPSGRVNPRAIEALGAAGVDTACFRSKSWDEFTAPGSPEMRIVITVCDSAAAETCPCWPGGPVKVHWGYPAIAYRMVQLLQLPLDSMSNTELQSALAAISKS